jgi:hypothetical protein
VPGAFDEPIEIIEPSAESIEILPGEFPGEEEVPEEDRDPSEQVYRIEVDKTIERGNPSEQHQNELATMSDQELLPPLDKGDRIKPVGMKYDILDTSNIRLWKKKIEGLLRLQKCWKVIENTRKMRLEKKTDLLTRAMQDDDYMEHNLLAVIYLTAYISEGDATAIKGLEISGDIWIYLIEKYKAVNPRRKVNLLIQLFT